MKSSRKRAKEIFRRRRRKKKKIEIVEEVEEGEEQEEQEEQNDVEGENSVELKKEDVR